jgi:hypothetical protein
MDEKTAAHWLARHYLDLGIEVSDRGRFGTIVDGELFLMSDNHVKSLLRRDFIEAHGHYPGINGIIAGFLAIIQKNAKLWTGPGRTHEVAYKLPT